VIAGHACCVGLDRDEFRGDRRWCVRKCASQLSDGRNCAVKAEDMRRFDQEVTAARRAAKDSVIAIVPMEVR